MLTALAFVLSAGFAHVLAWALKAFLGSNSLRRGARALGKLCDKRDSGINNVIERVLTAVIV
ncbi:MAG: hypothetical protein ACRD3W_09650 [Terriglobales bacterium]